MTLVSQIIIDAFRQSNLLAINSVPTAAQSTEALRYINRIVKSVFGYEAGELLVGYPVGSLGINRPAEYVEDYKDPEWYVPENTRLMLNLEEATTLHLHPEPEDGARLSVNDAAGNLATFPLTLIGNGNLIDGLTQVVLNTTQDTEWFYRADTANWQKTSPLAENDNFPFPEEFDDYFISMLAMRLNPAYGTSMDPQSQATLNRSLNQLRSRYKQTQEYHSELGLLRLAKMSADRDQYIRDFGMPRPYRRFNKGWL